jgi:protocatechuate 3,4-dioxygenase beta subunit
MAKEWIRPSVLFAVLATLLPVAALLPRLAASQDLEYIRALEQAQAQRPATIGSAARITPESEPGAPLVIHGRLLDSDGKSPVAGAIVFAYHTDREGLYNRRGAPPHSWRLRGWVRTGADGRFEFRTIRPGAYPSRNTPAHVHFTVFTSRARYHAGELRFADDPLVTDGERASSRRDGDFGGVRPVRREAGMQHVDFQLRLDRRNLF